MSEIVTVAASLLTAAGVGGAVGGAVGAYFQARFQQRTKLSDLEHELKQKRYLCIIILMLAKLTQALD